MNVTTNWQLKRAQTHLRCITLLHYVSNHLQSDIQTTWIARHFSEMATEIEDLSWRIVLNTDYWKTLRWCKMTVFSWLREQATWSDSCVLMKKRKKVVFSKCINLAASRRLYHENIWTVYETKRVLNTLRLGTVFPPQFDNIDFFLFWLYFDFGFFSHHFGEVDLCDLVSLSVQFQTANTALRCHLFVSFPACRLKRYSLLQRSCWSLWEQ